MSMSAHAPPRNRRTQSPTTTAEPPPPADPVLAYANDVLAGRIVAGPHVRAACRRHLDDLEHGHERGLIWRLDLALRVIGFFRDELRLNGSDFEGKPFELLPWQQFCVGSGFGWIRWDGHTLTEDGLPWGYRRFTTLYLEIGKGAGKSPLAAGIGLYCLVADKEARAEVYAAASKKDQAMVLFRDAVAMYEQSPGLKDRLVKTGGVHPWNLGYPKLGAFFRAISSDDGQSGPRPSCALVDELHEHPNGDVCDMLEAGFKFRRQPLIVKITNSGFDRETVCYRDHEYSIRIVNRTDTDDRWFAYVCALDPKPRTQVFVRPDDAARFIIRGCSVRTIPTESRSGGGSAQPAIPRSAGAEISRPDFDALITVIERSMRAACASLATPSSDAKRTPSTSARAEKPQTDGLREIEIEHAQPTSAGATETEPNTRSGAASRNTALTATSTSRSLGCREASAAFANGQLTLSESITAIRPELFEACSASSATLVSACWETTRLLYSELSSTCVALRAAKFEAGSVAVDLDADEPIGTRDDPFSGRACWIKTNPSLGITIRDEYIEDRIIKALGMPAKLSLLRRLNFCEWVGAEHPWIDGELWLQCEKRFDPFAVLRECEEVVGALDLGGTRDLTALTLAGEHPSGKIVAYTEFWTPLDTLEDRARDDRVPYDLWVEQGYMRATPGRAVDYAWVAQRMSELTVLLPFSRCCFDPYRIAFLEPEIDETGAELELISHPQGGYKTQPKIDKYGRPIPSLWMPRSIELLGNAIGEARIEVHENPCMTHCSASAVLVATDDKGNLIFSKRKSRGRIDGVVTLAMAVGLLESSDDDGALGELLKSPAIT